MTRLLALGACLTMAGCSGGGRPPVFPVVGTITVDGRPATGAFVVLHPRMDEGRRALKPNGQVGPDGSFRATTFDAGDGAPAGDYALTVVWPAPPKPDAPDAGEVGPDRLAGRYADPARPAASVTVRPGKNSLEPINLK